jgi:hypothetical protein
MLCQAYNEIRESVRSTSTDLTIECELLEIGNKLWIAVFLHCRCAFRLYNQP